MKLSIEGRFAREEGSWTARLPLLKILVSAKNPHLCLKQLCREFKHQIQNFESDCRFKVTNDDVFYLVLLNEPRVHEFLAQKIIETNSGANWDEEIRKHVKYEDTLEEEE